MACRTTPIWALELEDMTRNSGCSSVEAKRGIKIRVSSRSIASKAFHHELVQTGIVSSVQEAWIQRDCQIHYTTRSLRV